MDPYLGLVSLAAVLSEGPGAQSVRGSKCIRRSFKEQHMRWIAVLLDKMEKALPSHVWLPSAMAVTSTRASFTGSCTCQKSLTIQDLAHAA